MRSWILPLSFAAVLLATGCASTSPDSYARALQPERICKVGSRICREVDSRTGQAKTPFPVTTLYPNGLDLQALLSGVP